MKFHELNATPNKKDKRVGRGISAGQGKTAGRGTKGQKARTGKKLRPGFEGGQLPLMMRLPKLKGFKSKRVPAQVVYTSQLENFAGKTADNAALAEAGVIATAYHNVKIVLKGDLTVAVTVKTQGASKGAIEAIQAAGGTFEKIETPRKLSAKPKKD
jgi:large subunit ribosomal protein L15